MFKITETYKDFNDVERTEEFFFNLNKSELAKLELSVNGGLAEMLQVLIQKKDIKEMIKVFDMIIDASYGRKSLDGRNFAKNAEILEDFKSTSAYDQIYFRFATDTKFAAEFINGIIPQEVSDELEKVQQSGAANIVTMPTAPAVQ